MDNVIIPGRGTHSPTCACKSGAVHDPEEQTSGVKATDGVPDNSSPVNTRWKGDGRGRGDGAVSAAEGQPPAPGPTRGRQGNDRRSPQVPTEAAPWCKQRTAGPWVRTVQI